MTSKNDITGDSIVSRASTEQYRDNYDRIFCNVKKMQENITTPMLLPNSNYSKIEEDTFSIRDYVKNEDIKSRDCGELSYQIKDIYKPLTEKELTIFTGKNECAGNNFLVIHTGKGELVNKSSTQEVLSALSGNTTSTDHELVKMSEFINKNKEDCR